MKITFTNELKEVRNNVRLGKIEEGFKLIHSEIVSEKHLINPYSLFDENINKDIFQILYNLPLKNNFEYTLCVMRNDVSPTRKAKPMLFVYEKRLATS